VIAALTRNAGLKLLAVLIALGLWVLVSGEQESERVFNVPVDFRLSRDMSLVGESPGSVAVRVRGAESVLRGISAEDLSLPVDLSSAIPGRRFEHELDPRSVAGVPSGAAVDAIIPGRLLVGVERKISRSIPVTVHFGGNPAPGYRLSSYSVEPSSVTVEGPEDEVNRISFIPTRTVALTGKSADFTLLTGLDLQNPHLRLAGNRPVKVVVDLVRSEPEKR
jgi:YbbR domain-containing protein